MPLLCRKDTGIKENKANMKEVRMRKDSLCYSEYRENNKKVLIIETEEEARS